MHTFVCADTRNVSPILYKDEIIDLSSLLFRDFPNAWAPLQHMLIEGCEKTGLEEGRILARHLALRWLDTMAVGWREDGAMHEKYDARVLVKRGGGGEYEPQVHRSPISPIYGYVTLVKDKRGRYP